MKTREAKVKSGEGVFYVCFPQCLDLQPVKEGPHSQLLGLQVDWKLPCSRGSALRQRELLAKPRSCANTRDPGWGGVPVQGVGPPLLAFLGLLGPGFL